MHRSVSHWSLVIRHWGPTAAVLVALACGPSEVKPVDIFPEDICSHCRMAISDQRFAAEIIDTEGGASKFDDIACMLNFMVGHQELKTKALFVKDFETRQWIPYAKAVLLDTDVRTPMGSGKIAFADAGRARDFQTRMRESRP